MASKVVTPKVKRYGTIERGCSFRIPVSIRDEYDEALDLTGYKAAFTVKRYQQDFDRDDRFAFVKKDIELADPTTGMFSVDLTSDDTDFDAGEYYFDIELIGVENGVVWRLVTLSFTLVGGPTNRHVNPGFGQLPTGETINVITLTEGTPIIVVTPTVAVGVPDIIWTAIAEVKAKADEISELQDKVSELEQRLDETTRRLDDAMEQIEDINNTLN